MQVMLYFFKRLLNFLKIDLLLFKSVGKTKVLSFLFIILLLWCILFLYDQNDSLKKNIKMIQDALYWSAFAYFFYKLKKQNFFYHLVLNRGFYKAELEILLFLISIYTFFILVNTGFVFTICTDEIKKFIITTISILIDAFLFTLWQIRKYILLICIFFALTTLCSLALNYNNITTISDLTSLLSSSNNSDLPTIVIITIEIIIISRIIKNINNLH